ncbi:MAG: hypothetical protein ACPG4T_18995 [Nannocystaceae bacterium]
MATGDEDPAFAACYDREEAESCEYLASDGESTVKGECASYTCSGADSSDADCFSCVRTGEMEEGGCSVSQESRRPWIPAGLMVWFLGIAVCRRTR